MKKYVLHNLGNRNSLDSDPALPCVFADYFRINYDHETCFKQQPTVKPSLKTVIDGQKSTITVTSPNSNFALATGSTYTISWNCEGNPGTVKIALTNTSGSAPLIITTNVPGGSQGLGNFVWIVPQTLVTASGYLVRVTNLANSSITGVSQPFSIVPPSINITQPKPGELFYGGDRVIPITGNNVGKNFGSMVHITAWRAFGSRTDSHPHPS